MSTGDHLLASRFRLTPDDDAKMLKLRQQGVQLQHIAARLRVTPETVRRRLLVLDGKLSQNRGDACQT